MGTRLSASAQPTRRGAIRPGAHQVHRHGPRRLAALLLAVLTCLITVSCGVPLDSPAPGEDEVLAYVRDACPTEEFELVSTEELQSLPQQVRYTFRSMERDLTFTATSEINEASYTLLPRGPYPSISCDYAHEVRVRYQDATEAALRDALAKRAPETCSYLDGNGLTLFCGYTDIDAVIDAATEAGAVYDPELAYNTADWIRENIAIDLAAAWVPEGENLADPDTWELVGDRFALGKTFDAGTARSSIAAGYAQLVADGIAPEDPDLPEELLAGRHRRVIPAITVDGDRIPFEFDAVGDSISYADGNPYQRAYVSSGDPIACRWNDERERYEVLVDSGLIDGSWSEGAGTARRFKPGSWLITQMCRLTGGTASEEAGFSWSARGIAGEIVAGDGDIPFKIVANRIRDDQGSWFSGLLDAVDDDFDIDLPNDSGVWTGQVMSYVDVAEFAGLFDMSYRIDEEAGVLELTSR